MQYTDIQQLTETIQNNIETVMIGQEKSIRLILAAVIAGGHVLLEDVPGTGKTTLAKALACSLGGTFHRVQCTPDLLPADLTGMRVYQPNQADFVFIPGPVFGNILLADEINRATPRTQSALLECMEERQVTDGGKTYSLDKPFLVIATQNPIETQGTFPLPEAQLDRFLIQLSLGYPDLEKTVYMLKRFQNAQPLESIQSVCTVDHLIQAQALSRTCYVSEDVMRYIAEICEKARDPEKVRLGPSPRSALALMHICQAFAAMDGRNYVRPDDVQELMIPVLGHRMIMRGVMQKTSSHAFLREILTQVQVPTERVEP